MGCDFLVNGGVADLNPGCRLVARCVVVLLVVPVSLALVPTHVASICSRALHSGTATRLHEMHGYQHCAARSETKRKRPFPSLCAGVSALCL